MILRKKTYQTGQSNYRTPKIFAGSVKKEKTQWHPPKGFFKIIFWGLVFVLACYYLFFSSKFAIREVIVDGNNLLAKDQIASEVPVGQNIFFFNVEDIKKKMLADFPELKYVEIYRGLPNAIKVVVAEREGKAVWQSGDKSYLLSSQGEIAKQISPGVEDVNLPLIVDKKSIPVVLGSQIVSPNFIAFILNIYSNFYDTENIKPVRFEIEETTFDVNLYTDAGFYVKLNSLRSSKKQLDNLKQVLVQKRADIHEYVDLRIDGWAYYK